MQGYTSKRSLQPGTVTTSRKVSTMAPMETKTFKANNFVTSNASGSQSGQRKMSSAQTNTHSLFAKRKNSKAGTVPTKTFIIPKKQLS